LSHLVKSKNKKTKSLYFPILTDFRLEKVDLKKKMYSSAITAGVHKTVVYVGGQDDYKLLVAESYNTMDGTSFNQLTSIPVETSHQCLVIVNKTMLVMAGGWTDKGSTNNTYMYSKLR
jgi:hypothetical protein